MGDWMRCLTTRLGRGETILLLVTLLALSAGERVSAQGAPHRAGLVIRFGDGSVITRCVSFSEASITGIELLTRAGLSIRVDTSSSIGAGVCKIDSQGCDAGRLLADTVIDLLCLAPDWYIDRRLSYRAHALRVDHTGAQLWEMVLLVRPSP